MNAPEDRAWQAMLDRIDLDVSDADLAAAEQQLAAVAVEEAPAVRPEWIEATVAKAKAPAEALTPAAAPLRRVGVWRTVQRFAAAVVAFIGLHGTATAVGVTAVTVVSVAAALLFSGEHSSRNMSFRMALEILLRADQPDGDRRVAIKKVVVRLKNAIEMLQAVRDQQETPEELAAAARAWLGALQQQFAGKLSVPLSDAPDTLTESIAVVGDAAAPMSLRMTHLRLLAEMAYAGTAVLRAMPACSPSVETDRVRNLEKLSDLVTR